MLTTRIPAIGQELFTADLTKQQIKILASYSYDCKVKYSTNVIHYILLLVYNI